MDNWKLPTALGVRRGEVVALVGGGGKTSALRQLLTELTDMGWKVVACTTTHLGRDQSKFAPHHLVWEQQSQANQVSAVLRDHSALLVTGPLTHQGLRWSGLAPEWVEQIASLPEVDALLVEADGARTLPFKAPAAHEPVIPSCTTLLVPVVGVKAVGQALAAVSHRPEQVQAITGLSPTDRLSAASIAQVLAHPQGGLKARPPGARVRVLINQVDDDKALVAGRAIARELLSCTSEPEIEAAVIAALQTGRPVRELRRRVGALVLAAGLSRRMQADKPKQLLAWEGSTVIQKVVETLTACSSLSQPPVVITGSHADQVQHALQASSAHCIFNPDYATGEMISSLQAGLRALAGRVSACLVVLADQPWLEVEVIEALLDQYAASPAGIIAPSYQGKRGHPVLFDGRYWPELLQLVAEATPRQVLQAHQADLRLVPVATDLILRDMDTAEDYRQARHQLDAG